MQPWIIAGLVISGKLCSFPTNIECETDRNTNIRSYMIGSAKTT